MADKPIAMVHIRTFLFNSLSGHSIQFAGPTKPVMVPPAAVAECMAIGAAPADEVDMPDLSGSTPDRLEKAAGEPQGEDRKAVIKEAIKDLVGVNDTAAFDANGAPKLRAINSKVGFRVNVDERNIIWPEVKAELNVA